MLRILRQTMEVLAKEPILVDTGQYRPRVQMQNRSFTDMEGEIANFLAMQGNFQARVRLRSGEYVIRTKPAPETLSGDALTERIQAIKKHMRTLGITRHYTEVEAEIRERQLRLLGISEDTQPFTTNGQVRPSDASGTDAPEDTDELPPPNSFSLD
jgi:hypothetical protein